MAEPGRKRATDQDVIDAPEHLIAEIVDGRLNLSPRPGAPHTAAASMLVGLLVPPFSFGGGTGPGGWIVLFEPELHLGDDVLVPDLAGWRVERLPMVPQGSQFTMPPDWLCEVLSRSTGAVDRNIKLPIYARAGVRHVWLVDAQQRTLEVLGLHEASWRTLAIHRGDERIRAEPFAAVELELGRLWAYVVPPPPRGSRASEPTATYGDVP
jgi:Uma2 family endonuclease